MNERERNRYIRIATELGYTDDYPEIKTKLSMAPNKIAAERILYDCRNSFLRNRNTSIPSNAIITRFA